MEIPTFSSNEFLNDIVIGDKSASIIGFIDEISPIKKIRSRDNKDLDLFKFIVNNNEGSRVHCFSWNKESEIFAEKISLNQIVLLEMLTVKEPSNFNKGNVNYELLLKNYSSITTFGYFNENFNFDEMKITSFENLLEANGVIRIEGYLKNDFICINKNQEYFSVLTNLEYKIEITVSNCLNPIEAKRGQKISVIGTILKNDHHIIYMTIQSPDNIKIVDSKIIPLTKLLRGNKCIIKNL